MQGKLRCTEAREEHISMWDLPRLKTLNCSKFIFISTPLPATAEIPLQVPNQKPGQNLRQNLPENKHCCPHRQTPICLKNLTTFHLPPHVTTSLLPPCALHTLPHSPPAGLGAPTLQTAGRTENHFRCLPWERYKNGHQYRRCIPNIQIQHTGWCGEISSKPTFSSEHKDGEKKLGEHESSTTDGFITPPTEIYDVVELCEILKDSENSSNWIT